MGVGWKELIKEAWSLLATLPSTKLPVMWLATVVCAFLLGFYSQQLANAVTSSTLPKTKAAKDSVILLEKLREAAHARIDSLPVDSLQSEFDRIFPK